MVLHNFVNIQTPAKLTVIKGICMSWSYNCTVLSKIMRKKLSVFFSLSLSLSLSVRVALKHGDILIVVYSSLQPQYHKMHEMIFVTCATLNWSCRYLHKIKRALRRCQMKKKERKQEMEMQQRLPSKWVCVCEQKKSACDLSGKKTPFKRDFFPFSSLFVQCNVMIVDTVICGWALRVQ